MNYLIGLFAAFATTLAAAQTVQLSDGTIVEITVIDPSTMSAEQAIVETCSAGNPGACEYKSVQYCTYSQDKFDRDNEGYTFAYQNFVKGCDTNADGRYDYCLDYIPFQSGEYTFADQAHQRYCVIFGDVTWNPVQNRVLPDTDG